MFITSAFAMVIMQIYLEWGALPGLLHAIELHIWTLEWIVVVTA